MREIADDVSKRAQRAADEKGTQRGEEERGRGKKGMNVRRRERWPHITTRQHESKTTWCEPG